MYVFSREEIEAMAAKNDKQPLRLHLEGDDCEPEETDAAGVVKTIKELAEKECKALDIEDFESEEEYKEEYEIELDSKIDYFHGISYVVTEDDHQKEKAEFAENYYC